MWCGRLLVGGVVVCPLIAAHQPITRAKRTILEAPPRFEINRGQTDARVKFIARGPGYTMLLADREAVLNLRSGAIRMKLVGAGSPASARGLDQLPGVGNYLIGNDSSRWRTDVPAYARVQFDGVYPGVDTGSSTLSTTTGALDTTFSYSTSTGTNGDSIAAYAPTAFGDAFVAKFSADGKSLVYSTYLGGASVEGAETVAVNSSGQAAVMGATTSLDFPLKTEVTLSWVGLIYTGMIQANVQIPSDATIGTAVPLQLKIGSVTSRSDVTVAIKAKP